MTQGSTWVEDTRKLQLKMNASLAMHSDNPEVLLDFIIMRRNFLIEENVTELGQAIQERNADKAVDAMMDGIVVGIDALILLGVDPDEAWRRVYTANFSKSPGINPTRPNRFGLPDMIKPDDFVAPSHEGNLGLFEKAFNN